MRTFSDVSKEDSEIVPSWIDFDSTRTVIFVDGFFRITAPLMHVDPSVIEWVNLSNFSVSVLEVCISASARCGSAASKFAADSNELAATVALTEPAHLIAMVRADRSNRDQEIKTLICDIDGFGHDGLPTGCLTSGEVDVDSVTSLRHCIRKALVCQH